MFKREYTLMPEISKPVPSAAFFSERADSFNERDSVLGNVS